MKKCFEEKRAYQIRASRRWLKNPVDISRETSASFIGERGKEEPGRLVKDREGGGTPVIGAETGAMLKTDRKVSRGSQGRFRAKKKIRARR